MLGGKSVNGLPVLFAYEDSVPYHIYYKVMNAKKHGVPQNRERVFIIGIRDDKDNYFRWAKEEHLTKRLKDVLENEVDKKYFLDNDKINQIASWKSMTNPLRDNLYDKDSKKVMSCLLARGDGNEHAGMKLIKVKSATKKGYEEANEGDSINFSVPNSETRRGRVGKGVAQTLDTQCNQDTLENHNIRRLTPRECFRLMDFPDTFTWTCSDSQAYKQAGNSIVVRCLELIIKQFNL